MAAAARQRRRVVAQASLLRLFTLGVGGCGVVRDRRVNEPLTA
jgi:hypothetical protein